MDKAAKADISLPVIYGSIVMMLLGHRWIKFHRAGKKVHARS